MPSSLLSSEEPWVSPTSPPDFQLIQDIFEHLVAYHDKGPVKERTDDPIQKCLEFIIPLLSPRRFNDLSELCQYSLKRSSGLIDLLTDYYDSDDYIFNALRLNSPSATKFEQGSKLRLNPEPFFWTQTSDRVIRCQRYSRSLGVGLGFLWSPPVSEANAVEIKKKFNIEAVLYPGYQWRLDYLYMNVDTITQEFVHTMCPWYGTLRDAKKAFEHAHQPGEVILQLPGSGM